ncbi:MAG: class F sortase [Trebonia sp.]
MKLGWKKSEWTTFVVAAVISLAVAGGIFAFVRHGGSGGAGASGGADAGSAQQGPGSGSTARLASWSSMWNSGRLVIPSIGTDAPVSPEGATGPDGGSLTIPYDIHDVGWWDGVWQSPNGVVREKVAQPGQSGVALIAGHIDSAVQGKGALYRLQQVKPGASITVIGRGNTVTKWTVTRLQIVLKSDLPRDLFVDTGPARLAVVSCGGPFDAATGHYRDNVIAWAAPAR